MTHSVTLGVTSGQSQKYAGRYHSKRAICENWQMAERRTYKPTYIRAWREHRGLSLRDVANRMEAAPGEQLISHVSLGRIETGKQPYSQPILEALAVALNVSVSMLLEVDPNKEGRVVDILRQLDPDKRRQAEAILKAFAIAS